MMVFLMTGRRKNVSEKWEKLKSEEKTVKRKIKIRMISIEFF